MNACSGQAGTGERSVEFCDGFIVGTGLLYQELRRANVIDAWACATSVPTVDQIRQGFVTWARSNPQHTDERATNGFWRAMAELYPCKQ